MTSLDKLVDKLVTKDDKDKELAKAKELKVGGAPRVFLLLLFLSSAGRIDHWCR